MIHLKNFQTFWNFRQLKYHLRTGVKLVGRRTESDRVGWSRTESDGVGPSRMESDRVPQTPSDLVRLGPTLVRLRPTPSDARLTSRPFPLDPRKYFLNKILINLNLPIFILKLIYIHIWKYNLDKFKFNKLNVNLI